jgi:hypothetical protein
LARCSGVEGGLRRGDTETFFIPPLYLAEAPLCHMCLGCRLRLKNYISIEEWNLWVAGYTNRESIEKLERAIPHSLSDMKRMSQGSLRRDLQTWLLFSRLTASISPSSDYVISFYKKLHPSGKPALVEVENEIRQRAASELKEAHLAKWW